MGRTIASVGELACQPAKVARPASVWLKKLKYLKKNRIAQVAATLARRKPERARPALFSIWSAAVKSIRMVAARTRMYAGTKAM